MSSSAAKRLEEEEERKLELLAKSRGSAKGYNGYRKKSPVYGERDPEKRTLKELPKVGDVVEVWDFEQYERGKHKVTEKGEENYTHFYKVPYDGCKVGSIIKRFKVVGFTNTMKSPEEIANCKIHLECVYPDESVGICPLYIPVVWVIFGALDISKVEKTWSY